MAGTLPLLTAVIWEHATLGELGDRMIELGVRPLWPPLALAGPREMDHCKKRGAIGQEEEHVVVVHAPANRDRTPSGEYVCGAELARELSLEPRRGRAPRVEPLQLSQLRQDHLSVFAICVVPLRQDVR
jgi:hypothetical protein